MSMEVEIDVEALLNHLCCNDDVTLGTLCGPLSKEFEHPAVTRRTLSCQEARVQQGSSARAQRRLFTAS